MKGFIYPLLLGAINIGMCKAQCVTPGDNVYWRKEDMPASEYYMSKALAIENAESKNAILKIDTSNEIVDYSSGIPLQNKSFIFFSKENAHDGSVDSYVRSTLNDSVYFIESTSFFAGVSPFDYNDIKWQNQNFILIKGIKSSSIFYFKTKQRVSIPTTDIYPVGMNDTVLFLLSGEESFKLNHEKHYCGTLVQLSSSGETILSEGNKENRLTNNPAHSFYHEGIFYYDGNYRIQYHFLNSLDENCKFYLVYSIKVFYHESLTDSFILKSEHGSVPGANNLQMNILNSSDTLSLFDGDEYYRYHNGIKLLDIDLKELYQTVSTYPDKGYRVINDYAVYEMGVSSDESKGKVDINNEAFTLNMLKVDAAKRWYNLFLLFNIKTKEFLGYPKIVFAEKK